ncbi:MAG TPA: response regulator [Leptospiraceae bacterium]|nr:response regulator [Leptospiraceae bacterium]HMW06731.1 response regulator [Leptospiraceae bacterium]HMX33526.1 response regulator [Leptospiraceae bacterium]HMY32037.1 response regulator [Leptospiraceae bacterium]HMZ67299.1 response regulator [Leptospiraceae bacterium]
MSILAIDDEVLNLKLIEKLIKHRYRTLLVQSGKEALAQLEKGGREIKCILLDWNMPEMNGLDFLKIIKADSRFQRIPVIIQTIDTSKDTLLAGMSAGAFQYLLKPYDEKTLISHVHLAVQEYDRYHELLKNFEHNMMAFTMIESAEFTFNTIDEAQKLASVIASLYPDPENVVIGISDLFANAIEHGNLNITYEEKTKLLEEGKLLKEIDYRLSLPENKLKKVRVKFQKSAKEIRLRIIDQGNGFDFQKYLNLDELKLFESHGRGIYLAKKMSFDQIFYHGNGNDVETVVYF